MALIDCPDCGAHVSDAAPACPSCGRPITRAVTTIEKTGKPFKAVMLVSLLMAIIGFVIAGTGGGAAGIFVLAVGIIAFIGALIGAWWSHG